MRALTVRQPFASALVLGVRPLEIRSRPWTAGEERILIHAAAADHRIGVDYMRDARRWPACSAVRSLPHRAILGSVLVLGSLPLTDLAGDAWAELPDGIDPTKLHAWILADAHPLDAPIPWMGGALGLWTYPGAVAIAA